MKKIKQGKGVIQIYTDGSGMRPDGKGSAIAWIRKDTGEKRVEPKDGLTNNEAEYGAVLSAIKHVPKFSEVEVLSDSELVCCQFAGKWKIADPSLIELLSQIREEIKRKELKVELTWIPRRENRAGKMI
jgi:ribonuclease HI